MARRIQILDTTLRDGEQSPGIALQPHEKATIAEQLERLGVDVVEAGFPGASPGDFAGVQAVAQALERPTVAAFARAVREDLDAAAGALADAKRSRVHIVLATSPIHMERKLNLEPAEVLARARFAVGHVARLVDEVEFSCEDATRSDPEFVARVCRVVIEAGATVVNLPDTVGYALPHQYASFLTEVRRRCPELRRVTLSAHCHNDLGLAVANSLAAVEAGAQQVECTVNGIGERAGNASLEEIVVALKVRSDHFDVETGIDTEQITASSKLVSELTGYVVQRNKAVVGANAFAHEAGIHQDGMLKDARTYQIIDPVEVGVHMTLPLGKHSGRHAFARACAERGIQLSGDDLNAAFRRFKALADSRGAVPLDAVFEGVPA
ncbi:MAG TPA: 2-isopropylmalate synthase [Gaiellaceae bacterium]|nr:2-isopropylmalate synthase [Gaiellaceae bacterium]